MTDIARAAFWGPDGLMLAESTGAAAQRAYDARHADPLTVAYISMGAERTYTRGRGFTALGQTEYIADCIRHALMLDCLAPQVENTDANFYYEFAEPFGERYGAQLLAGQAPDANAIALEILKELQA